MNEISEYNNTMFESIKHTDENGCEYWEARELQKVLEYKRWDKFCNVIEAAMIACKKSNNEVFVHFSHLGKTSKMPNGGVKNLLDYKLSRYACYLIVQNADSNKEAVALGQTYFAVQTRKQELKEIEYSSLSEDEKRIYRRRQTKDGNKALYRVALDKGVKNFDRFTNAGYKGLYNGETADDIAKRKKLRYREEILDNMGSVELGANIFRITQTESLLEKQKELSEELATDTHYKVGAAVRDTIKMLGSTMPEDLPTPEKSIKDLENKNFIDYK